jgi:hypothetical protein
LILSTAVSIRSRTGVIIFKIEGVERAERSLWGEKERKVTVEGSEKKERRVEGGEEERRWSLQVKRRSTHANK